MNTKETLDRAMEVARKAHQGQLDKTGAPYFDHCRRVAEEVASNDEKVVAYLHDVVEKTCSWSIERLEAEGFAPPIVHAVQSLTRVPSESDDHFVRRAMADRLARRVKIADLNDNLVQVMQVGGDIGRLARELSLAKIVAVDE